MNRKCLFSILLILALTACAQSAMAAEAPYYTMTEDHRGNLVYSQTGYLPDLSFYSFDGKDLRRPADLFVDEQERIFIADDGNKRVILCTAEGELIRVFGEGELRSPGGVFAKGGKLYVADSREDQVFVYEIETGKQVMILENPDTILYGKKNKFQPLKIAVDNAGCIYVISKGNTNGIAQFSADGAFLGYFGANNVSLSPMQKLTYLLYTDAQRSTMLKNIPSTPTNLDMDDRGLVYTVTSGVKAVRRLSMAGNDTMNAMRQGMSNVVDVAVGSLENIFVVSDNGYIMEYTRDGRLLFYFGGQDAERSRSGLFNSATAIDVDQHERIYVLDRDRGVVQRFAITEYARLVHKALSLYQQGLYAESREPWEAVLSLNSLFDYAQTGLGKSYYRLGMYDEALRASRLGGDQEGYSDAFWEVRNQWLQSHILEAVAVIMALSILWKLIGHFRKGRKGGGAALSDTGGKKPRLLGELGYMTHFLKNPADAFYGVRCENKVSVLSASILYVAFYGLFTLDKYACGFLFKGVADGHYEVAFDLALVFGGILLFLIACNLICSIREGEGTLKQMYCAMAYCLTPYLVLKPISFALTFVLTKNEAFLVRLIDVAAIVWCLVLIVLMVKYLQDYTFRGTFVAIGLTLFTILMLIIAMVVALAMVAQLWEFLQSIWREVWFRYEG